jgi:hypothetical protein
MKFNQNPNSLPVFHHVAKNAGTYVLGWMLFLATKYFGKNIDSCKVIRVILNSGKSLSFVSCFNEDCDQEKYKLKVLSESAVQTNQASFLELLKDKQIKIFSASIDPFGAPGWYREKEYLQEIQQFLGLDHLLHFMVLRSPYNRAQSLFNYISGDDSSHEISHKLYRSKNFIEFLSSRELEDCWVIRNLLDLNDNQPILPEHFFSCCNNYFQYFAIEDISNVDALIDRVFLTVYGIDQNAGNKEKLKNIIGKNPSTYHQKIAFEELPEEAREAFLHRAYWDIKLHERYCKNV